MCETRSKSCPDRDGFSKLLNCAGVKISLCPPGPLSLRDDSLNYELWDLCVNVKAVWHLGGSPLSDLNQLPKDGVVGALQGLDGYLFWHGALLDARFQQAVATSKQVPACQVMSTEGRWGNALCLTIRF